MLPSFILSLGSSDSGNLPKYAVGVVLKAIDLPETLVEEAALGGSASPERHESYHMAVGEDDTGDQGKL